VKAQVTARLRDVEERARLLVPAVAFDLDLKAVRCPYTVVCRSWASHLAKRLVAITALISFDSRRFSV
jgi:hypothetical protein